jgi:predicted membrane metal-binding protein
VILGVITLADVAVLLVWDAFPRLFPARSHDFLAAFSMAGIAVAYLVYQGVHRPPGRELIKAVLLAVAFLFWGANQLWPDSPRTTLYNDIAIALFVLDVFLVMIGWPPTSPDESFAETYAEAVDEDRS